MEEVVRRVGAATLAQPGAAWSIVDASARLHFHGTVARFESFRVQPWGVHFGTFDQAAHVATQRLARLAPRAFARLEEDVRGWRGRIVSARLSLGRVVRLEDHRTPDAWARAVASAREAGFDSIVYLNAFEGRHAADSFIVFSRAQIDVIDWSAAAGGSA